MFDFLKYHPRLPGLDNFPIASYAINFSLDRLVVGVDNIRYDVRLSPAFCKATGQLAGLLIERETGIWTAWSSVSTTSATMCA
jgi:hypothetical protein